MSSTAVDDQLTKPTLSRDEAISEMAATVCPTDWREGGAMRYRGHTITWGEYVMRRHEIEDEEKYIVDLWEEGEERIDRIAQSDASGDHYAEAPCGQCRGYEEPRSTPSKYHREIKPGVYIDVYDVLQAFDVRNPALQHLIKKALAAGKRGHKDLTQDMDDIIDSAIRAKDLES
jgi:hypothetical protein